MDRTQLIALFDLDQRKNAAFPGMRRENTPDVVRLVNTSGSGEGMVAYSRLTADNAEEVIRAQVRYFEGIGQDFEWKVYDYDQPPDLKDRLAALGFSVGEAEALVVLDLEDAPQALWQTTGRDVRRILDPEDLADVQAVEEQVWGGDASWVQSYLGGALRSYPQRMSVYAAYVDGHPASAAWIYFPPNSQFASLWGGATVGAYRRQGLYSALLAVRAQEARARQVRYLTVDASPMSRPILEKFGFERIAFSHACTWKRNSPTRHTAA